MFSPLSQITENLPSVAIYLRWILQGTSIINNQSADIALKWQILWETNKFQVSVCFIKFVRRFFVDKNELLRTTKTLISRAGWSAPLLFAHILRRVFSATHHRSSTSRTTFVWIALQWRTNIHTLKHWVYFCVRINRNWIVVKVIFSKSVRGNEEWQIESVIKHICHI